MAVPDRRPRLDSYGKPLPELTDARQAVTMQEPGNEAKISLLHALVEDACRAVLRREWYGTVTIRLTVKDGMIQPDLYAGLDRNWKHLAEHL
jgi:hypothetical protein